MIGGGGLHLDCSELITRIGDGTPGLNPRLVREYAATRPDVDEVHLCAYDLDATGCEPHHATCACGRGCVGAPGILCTGLFGTGLLQAFGILGPATTQGNTNSSLVASFRS